MNRRRRAAAVGLVLLLLGACGGSGGGGGGGLPSDARPTAGGSAPGEVRRAGVAVATVGDGTLVVGGIEGDGTIVQEGVLVGAGGERSTFDLGVALVDLSIAVAADQVYVAGRECADDAQATDLGVDCDQRGPVVVRADPVSGAVEPVAETELAAASPRATVQVFAWDDRVVAQVRDDAAVRLFVIDPGDDPATYVTTSLPSPPETGITCATSTTLYSDLPSKAETMTDAGSDDPDAESGRGSGLARLRPDDSGWTEVEAPAGGHRWSVRACSSTHLVEIPGSGPVTSVLVLDDRSSWQMIELPAGDAFRTPVVLTNPEAPSFVLADSGTWIEVDPEGGADLAGGAELIDTGARAVTPSPTTFLTADGEVRDVTDAGEVGPLW